MKQRAALLMLLPATGFFLLSFVAPMVIAGRLSFSQGLGLYIESVRDMFFQKSFLNSSIMVMLAGVPQVILSYSLASFFSRFDKKTQAAARFAAYVPGLASGVVMGLLWKWMLNRAGLLNQIIALVGIGQVPWLSEVWPSRFALALIVLTGGLGGMTIMFSASLAQVPKELHDAARIDGASDRQYRRMIVRPMMRTTILLMLMLSFVGMMQIWETTYILWQNGGPEGGISSPVYEIFMTAFMFGKQPLAAAKGIILMLVIAAFLVVKNRVEKLALK